MELNEKVVEYNKNKMAIEDLEALNFEKDNFETMCSAWLVILLLLA